MRQSSPKKSPFFAIGVVYPPDEIELSPTYYLSLLDRKRLCTFATGAVVTSEHNGAKDAYTNIRNSYGTSAITERNFANEIRSAENAVNGPIGEVIELFMGVANEVWAVMRIDCLNNEVVHYLIDSGVQAGLSLTTLKQPTACMEVTLCNRPAREGCYIHHTTNDLIGVGEYKRHCIFDKTILAASHRRIMTTPTPATAAIPEAAPLAVVDPFDKIMNQLSPDDRSFLIARYTAAIKESDNHKREASQYRQELDTTQKVASFSEAMLKQQIAGFIEKIPDELATGYQCRDTDNLISQLNPSKNSIATSALARVFTMANLQNANVEQTLNTQKSEIEALRTALARYETRAEPVMASAAHAPVAATPAVEVSAKRPRPDDELTDEERVRRLFSHTIY